MNASYIASGEREKDIEQNGNRVNTESDREEEVVYVPGNGFI